jgi:hypothetical protein
MTAAVLLISYNRPELAFRRLSELASMDVIPRNVILSIDGHKDLDDNKYRTDYSSTLASQELPFEVLVKFRDSNLGCSKHIITAVTEVLEDYEKVIVVEDDVVLSPFFLSSMLTAFNISANIDNIATIGGFSNFHKRVHFPFFFRANYWRSTSYFSAWGWGTTRKFWENFVSIDDIDDLEQYLSTSTFWKEMGKRKQNIWLKRFRRGVWDYNVQLILFKLNKLNMLPSLRIIDNEGFSDNRSTHTKHRRPKNLFGVGFSNQKPSRFLLFSPISINRFFWNFVDSNLWAADGFFNSRAREKGLRTQLKQFFQLIGH